MSSLHILLSTILYFRIYSPVAMVHSIDSVWFCGPASISRGGGGDSLAIFFVEYLDGALVTVAVGCISYLPSVFLTISSMPWSMLYTSIVCHSWAVSDVRLFRVPMSISSLLSAYRERIAHRHSVSRTLSLFCLTVSSVFWYSSLNSSTMFSAVNVSEGYGMSAMRRFQPRAFSSESSAADEA